MHQIRLHGPWKFVCGSSEKKIKFPCNLSSITFEPDSDASSMPSTSFSLIRVFHCPTGIDPSQQVVLLFGCHSEPVQISLNGNSIDLTDHFGAMKIDVTGQLEYENRIEFQFQSAAVADVDLFTEASLQILG